MKIPDRVMAKAMETTTVLLFKGLEMEQAKLVLDHVLKENEEFMKMNMFSRVVNALKNLDAKNEEQVQEFINKNDIK
tara:strand:+ start:1056 stop:1286 length:231 start_codon:yes stop_codon:yes gene_type:complete